MTAQVFTIRHKQRELWIEPAKPDLFTLSDPQDVDPQAAFENGPWHLYCLEPGTRRALFLDLPDDHDLSQATFAYDMQFQKATRALVMDFETILDVARNRPGPAKHLLVFSTGRCGSTLFSRVLAALPGIWSLSEPDAFTNLALAKPPVPDTELVPLLRAAMALQWRPPAGQHIFAPKFRSEVFTQIPAYQEALPGAVGCFLYRDMIGFANSSYKLIRNLGFFTDPLPYEAARERWQMISGTPPAALDAVLEGERKPVSPELFVVARWLDRMAACKAAVDAGHDLHLISYASMTTSPQAAFGPVLAACGIDPALIAKASEVFSRDSQAGTDASTRGKTEGLSADQIDALNSLYARCSPLQDIAAFLERINDRA